MRTEEECKTQERYLFADELFSDKEIALLKKDCIRRCQDKPKGEAYENFLRWNKSRKEVMLFTLYAYADFKVPKTFDCLFDLKNPANFIHTPFTLTHSIYEGWYPMDGIEDGHKHACVFEFEKEIPEIISVLTPDLLGRVGICQSEDFEQIRRRKEYTLLLQKEHGMNWWKFDEEAE